MYRLEVNLNLIFQRNIGLRHFFKCIHLKCEFGLLGGEYSAVVEFAPFQKIPKKKTKKSDSKKGTIEEGILKKVFFDFFSFVARVKFLVKFEAVISPVFV